MVEGLGWDQDIGLTEDDIDQLWDNLVNQTGEDLSIEINGRIYDDYSDLVNLEKEQRTS